MYKEQHRGAPKLYAHRGAASERPENTLVAFRRALDLGADALELDVHLTLDGHVVVSHDPDGARMTGVAQEIGKTNLSDVVQWDAGYGFVNAAGERPFAKQDSRIPTFEQVLVEFPGVPLNVDLKPLAPAIVPTVLALLRRLRAQERVLLASFHSSTLRHVRRRGYEGPTGLGRSEIARLALLPRTVLHNWPLRGAAAQLPLRTGPIRLDTPAFIHRCRDLGLSIHYWTINQPCEALRLLDLGADGLMTDDPGSIVPVFNQWRTQRTGKSTPP